MLKVKKARQRGKPRLSHLFSDFKKHDKVVLVLVPGGMPAFPKRFHGRVAEIISRQGNAYIVRFKNGKIHKQLTVKAVNLRKLEG